MDNTSVNGWFSLSDNSQLFECPEIYSLQSQSLFGRITHVCYLKSGLVQCTGSVQTVTSSRFIKSYELGDYSITTKEFDPFEWEIPETGSEFQAVSLGNSSLNSKKQNLLRALPGPLKIVKVIKFSDSILAGKVKFFDNTEVSFYRKKNGLGNFIVTYSKYGSIFYLEYSDSSEEYIFRAVKYLQSYI
jgi:hypothetical protein